MLKNKLFFQRVLKKQTNNTEIKMIIFNHVYLIVKNNHALSDTYDLLRLENNINIYIYFTCFKNRYLFS